MQEVSGDMWEYMEVCGICRVYMGDKDDTQEREGICESVWNCVGL